jgi:hypothetical protein
MRPGACSNEVDAPIDVIAGLVPAISIRGLCLDNRDGRDKPGHDESM